MSARILVLFCLLMTVFLITGLAGAQQPKKIPRIGYIAARSGPEANEKAFLEGLQSLGYFE